jgi:hypothetical protein
VPFVPAADTVKVDIQSRLFGQVCDNTLWFRFRAGEPDIPAMIALNTAINDFWIATMLPEVSQDVKFIGSVVTGQWSLVAPAVAEPRFGEAGGIVDDSEPGNVTMTVTFLTAGRGRSSVGRNYVIGIPVGVRSGNQVSGAFNDNLVIAYQAILASAFDADWEWSVVSHISGGVDRVTALVQAVIGARSADVNLDSQRRRLTGRGT